MTLWECGFSREEETSSNYFFIKIEVNLSYNFVKTNVSLSYYFVKIVLASARRARDAQRANNITFKIYEIRS